MASYVLNNAWILCLHVRNGGDGGGGGGGGGGGDTSWSKGTSLWALNIAWGVCLGVRESGGVFVCLGGRGEITWSKGMSSGDIKALSSDSELGPHVNG
jgi:hypothetical protein